MVKENRPVYQAGCYRCNNNTVICLTNVSIVELGGREGNASPDILPDTRYSFLFILETIFIFYILVFGKGNICEDHP